MSHDYPYLFHAISLSQTPQLVGQSAIFTDFSSLIDFMVQFLVPWIALWVMSPTLCPFLNLLLIFIICDRACSVFPADLTLAWTVVIAASGFLYQAPSLSTGGCWMIKWQMQGCFGLVILSCLFCVFSFPSFSLCIGCLFDTIIFLL